MHEDDSKRTVSVDSVATDAVVSASNFLADTSPTDDSSDDTAERNLIGDNPPRIAISKSEAR